LRSEATPTSRTRPPTLRDRRRVLVVSADIGAGHRTPAELIVRELRGSDSVTVETIDGIRAMGRLLTLLIRDNSWVLFNRAPWLFELQYLFAARFPPTRWLAMRIGYLLGSRRFLRELRRRSPDLVISTYPGATAMLGELRRRGLVRVPVVGVITDVAGLHYWAHPGVDLHLVANRESLREVERIAGAGSVRWMKPPIPAETLDPIPQREARRRLDLPLAGRVIAVSGGGWGVGDLGGAVETALQVEPSAVLCLAGRNPRVRRVLERRFGTDPRVRLLGFTNRMNAVLGASDMLVHSTGGLTELEARCLGCPVISYGFNVGHVKLSNRAFQRLGLARVATDRRQLRKELERALDGHRRPLALPHLPSVTELALGATGRIRPSGAVRLWLRRAANGFATVGIVLAGLLCTDDVYPVVADTFHISPVSRVSTDRPIAGILVDATPAAARRLASEMRGDGISASFALDAGPSGGAVPAIMRRGDEAVARTHPNGPLHLFGGDLGETANHLGLGSHFLYEAGDGFTLGQYLVARAEGGSPVRGAVRDSSGGPFPSLSPGEVVDFVPPSGRRAAERAVSRLRAQLTAAGLRGVTVTSLLRSRET
jgi:processive 1,2-diacylglycerol beta-glucosyltransferase